MTAELETFQSKFRVDELLIKSTDCWSLSLRPAQLTLGSMVLSDRTGATAFSELSSQHAAEFQQLLQQSEQIAFRFGAKKLNVLCLMLVDPIVHYHIIPRYSEPVQFEGKEFSDRYWPKPIDIPNATALEVDLSNLLNSIRATST